MDHNGADIMNYLESVATGDYSFDLTTASEMGDYCSSLPGCRAFNSDGWLKLTGDNLATASGYCIYVQDTTLGKGTGQDTTLGKGQSIHSHALNTRVVQVFDFSVSVIFSV